MCRRSLEGLAKTALCVELQREVLATQAEALPPHVNLGKPLLKLAGSVPKGGDLGAYFSLEEESTQELATLVLYLCEELIEYLVALLERIDDLNVKLESLAKSGRAGVY
ncbi:hypothetical protein ACQ86G_29185 [Roseateles chitinivorans]|uniref:hypothetical protein n=1 Tax=Roseateles chitinivorans TaxID=2917965 RepID=UPI003D66F6B1